MHEKAVAEVLDRVVLGRSRHGKTSARKGEGTTVAIIIPYCPGYNGTSVQLDTDKGRNGDYKVGIMIRPKTSSPSHCSSSRSRGSTGPCAPVLICVSMMARSRVLSMTIVG